MLHLIETLIWAAPLYVSGIIPNLRDAYYYVLESYTTLGEGNISLPYAWRLIGPIIAISGLFTFGWTGSVLVNVMSDFMKLDKDQSNNDHRKAEFSFAQTSVTFCAFGLAEDRLDRSQAFSRLEVPVSAVMCQVFEATLIGPTSFSDLFSSSGAKRLAASGFIRPK